MKIIEIQLKSEKVLKVLTSLGYNSDEYLPDLKGADVKSLRWSVVNDVTSNDLSIIRESIRDDDVTK